MNKKTFLSLFLFYSITINATTSEYSFLFPAQLKKIAYKIWNNECNQSKEKLTCWREGENFASVGICHFIWYSSGEDPLFTQTFPEFLMFAQNHNQVIPPYLTFSKACPWKTREEFYNQFQSKPMVELRDFLYTTIDLQMLFLIERFQKAIPTLLSHASYNQQSELQKKLNLLTQTSEGWYVVLDYINFKGEGINPRERYNGDGWGLLQVLQRMKDTNSTTDAIKEFAQAAQTTLRLRVAHAPAERKEFEKKWLPGWLNRIGTYSLFSV